MHLVLPEELLALAALTAVTGYLVACWQRGRWPRLRSLVAGSLLSASAGASAVYLALSLALLPLTPAGAGLLGFAVGAVWGPSGLWRLVGWLGPRAPQRRPVRQLRPTRRPSQDETQDGSASNPPPKVLD